MLSDKYEVSEDEGNNGNIPVTIRKHLNALKRYSKELQNKELMSTPEIRHFYF